MLENEEKLVNRAKKDKKAFGKLYEYYWPKVVRYLQNKVNGNLQTAEDLASTTFEKALKNISSYKWQGTSFSAWIYKIAYNTYVDYLRGLKTTVELDIEHLIPDSRASIEDRLIDDEISITLKNLLTNLKDREQVIIKLKFYEGYSNKKIAEVLNISETNIGTIINRAITKLRDI
ncbi:MAG: hypothetical protein QG570_147 [Patescibacteria group bacterium]|nr:hypothetical protein [Patescibacteria group bacterium]